MSTPTGHFCTALTTMLRACFPVIVVESHEDQRVLAEINAVVTDPEAFRTARPMHVWTSTRGFHGTDGSVA